MALFSIHFCFIVALLLLFDTISALFLLYFCSLAPFLLHFPFGADIFLCVWADYLNFARSILGLLQRACCWRGKQDLRSCNGIV